MLLLSSKFGFDFCKSGPGCIPNLLKIRELLTFVLEIMVIIRVPLILTCFLQPDPGDRVS